MAFSYVVSGIRNVGSLKIVYGTYNSAGVTGGTINTGLKTVYTMFFSGSGATVDANMPSTNTTFPASKNVTIVTTSNATGNWIAIGR